MFYELRESYTPLSPLPFERSVAPWKMSWTLGHWQVILPTSSVAFAGSMRLSTTALDNSLLIPLYVASASALFLILRIVYASYPVRSLEKCFVRILWHSKEQDLPEAGLEGHESSIPARSLITDLGGPIIYGFKIARFLGCTAFLGLATVALILQGDHRGSFSFQDLDCSQLAVCATAVSEHVSSDPSPSGSL